MYIILQVCIQKNQPIVLFGFMHMGATNICTWVRVIVIETLHYYHETETAYETIHGSRNQNHSKRGHGEHHQQDGHGNHALAYSKCAMHTLIGESLSTASNYMYPCVVEYSLICAGRPMELLLDIILTRLCKSGIMMWSL